MPDSPGLHVFTSAQLGPLRDHFVQSQGMRRWLTLQLADALGCTGSKCPNTETAERLNASALLTLAGKGPGCGMARFSQNSHIVVVATIAGIVG